MAKRRYIPRKIKTQVYTLSKRRCAFCFGLNDDRARKRGQIAHIDKDPSNNSMDNLAYLCLVHHDEYDSRTSQSAGLTESELRTYRKNLYECVKRKELGPGKPPSIDPRNVGKLLIAIFIIAVLGLGAIYLLYRFLIIPTSPINPTATRSPHIAETSTSQMPTSTQVAEEISPTAIFTKTPIPTPTSIDTELPNLIIGELLDNSLADDAYDEYEFSGQTNVPLLFSIERTYGDLWYELEIDDPRGDKVFSVTNLIDRDSLNEIPFTPLMDGTFVARVIGTRYFGEYKIGLEYIDGPGDFPNVEKTLEINEEHTDSLADDAIDEFQFSGQTNVPLLFSIERTYGDLWYHFEIYDPRGDKVFSRTNLIDKDSLNEIPFTPLMDGTFIARIIGTRNFGEYKIGLEYIDGTGEFPNVERTLEIDKEYTDSLADEAFDDYQFSGQTNVPYLISIERTYGDLWYHFEIYDPRGDQVFSRTNLIDKDSLNEIPFTPLMDGTFVARVIGTRNFGEYRIHLSRID